MSEASYCYKNKSIYFNNNIADEDLVEFAIHECIHYIQEVRDKRDKVVRMGLSIYDASEVYGQGLNEASVQLMASKIIGIEKDYVKYFGISFETISPSYYPVECCLANQLAFLFGEELLFESTINSNDNFKNSFIKKTSAKTFLCVQDALDKILEAEEKIVKYNNEFFALDDTDKKCEHIQRKIQDLKEDIRIAFLKTQNIIISNYFNNEIKKIKTLEDVESYRRKLDSFKEYIGTAEGYTYYNDYYNEKMDELEQINIILENSETSLTVIDSKENIFKMVIKKIKALFIKKEIVDDKK